MHSGTGLGTATLRLSLWICKAARWRPCDHECVTDEVQPGERRPCEAQGGLCISSRQCSWSSCCWQFNRNSLSIITYLRSALSAMGMCLFTELMYKIDGSWSYLAAPWKWGKKPSLQMSKEYAEHTGCTQMACILMTLLGGELRTACSSVVGDRHHSKRVWAQKTFLSLNCSNPFRAVVGCVWHWQVDSAPLVPLTPNSYWDPFHSLSRETCCTFTMKTGEGARDINL